MAVGAEKVGPLATRKVSRPLPMKPGLPVSENVSMTFAAESVAFGKLDQFPVEEPQFIPVLGIVTIKAPPHALRVVQHDIDMLVL